MKEYLTEGEILKIEKFNQDPELVEAVRKVLLQGLYSHGVIEKGKKHNPLQNGALSLVSLSTKNPLPDEQLGAHIRGIWAGLNALENAFEDLVSIKSAKDNSGDEPVNEAI